jgi:N6-L-threonylcarbamoyladenine synthase
MRILAIESSCDESAAAFLEVKRGRILRLESIVATQAIHAKFGGVVPEVAAREHSAAMPHVLDVIAEKVVGVADGRKLGRAVDVVAATQGPGLVTSLKVGLDTGRALAAAWGKKFVGVNHIAGHVAASWLPGAPLELGTVADRAVFPALALVVSGGHTELLLMPRQGEYRLLGATRDDAAGEAFDKTAKLLGLGYPGGPALAKAALAGDPSAFDFPRPMIHDKHDDFSFSGLKTAVRYFVEQNRERLVEPKFIADVSASTQRAITSTLVAKSVRAAEREKVRTVILAGGVAANAELRESLRDALAAKLPAVRFAVPAFAYCTDNAAMIAVAAYFQANRRRFTDWRTSDADGGWELGRG